MNLRRLIPFFFWCRHHKTLNISPHELEKVYQLFLHCLVPHKNLNKEAVIQFYEYLKQWKLKDLFDEYEYEEIKNMLK